MEINITADGETVAVRTDRCPGCPKGVRVQESATGRYIGHVATLRHGNQSYALYWAAIVSMTCPGDVRPSTAHGILRRGKHRMAAHAAGLRTLVALRNT